MALKRTLPPELAGRAFFTTEHARALGVTRAAMADLARPHHGVLGLRMPRTVLEDAQALELVLPGDCVFTHRTAAWLRGLPLPARWTPDPRPRLDVGRFGRTPPRRTTVRGHRLGAQPLGTVRVPGLRSEVIGDAHLFRQLAGVLLHTDLVVLGDVMTGWQSPLAPPDLEAGLSVRSPGLVAARAALAQVTGGVASAMESRMRQDFVRGGLPAPELNARVCDEDGRTVAFVDFLWRSTRVIVEYNGEHHFATAQQRLDDEARRNRLERLGYTVIVVNRIDYFQHHAETMAAIRRALGLAAA